MADTLTIAEFIATLSHSAPPAGLRPVLVALWHDGRGDWDAAHNVAQDIPDPDGAWVHAYLHRKEGDAGNAAYWYRRASKPVARASLHDEWTEIVEAFLK
jgi:hypothetical protein